MNQVQISQQIKKLEKRVLLTRLSAIPLLIILFLGYKLNVPLQIVGPIAFVIMGGIILGVGFPTQRNLSRLKKQLNDM